MMTASEAVAHAAETTHEPFEVVVAGPFNTVKFRCIDCDIEELAAALCDTYCLTVDPENQMRDAFSKITEKTREHWRAQAVLLQQKGWRR